MSEPPMLVADDHPLFRAAILHVLRERFAQYKTLEAASAATVSSTLQEHPEVELVLLDLTMPGARGFPRCCMYGASIQRFLWSSLRPMTTPV